MLVKRRCLGGIYALPLLPLRESVSGMFVYMYKSNNQREFQSYVAYKFSISYTSVVRPVTILQAIWNIPKAFSNVDLRMLNLNGL
jgi:hypothetical protein